MHCFPKAGVTSMSGLAHIFWHNFLSHLLCRFWWYAQFSLPVFNSCDIQWNSHWCWLFSDWLLRNQKIQWLSPRLTIESKSKHNIRTGLENCYDKLCQAFMCYCRSRSLKPLESSEGIGHYWMQKLWWYCENILNLKFFVDQKTSCSCKALYILRRKKVEWV